MDCHCATSSDDKFTDLLLKLFVGTPTMSLANEDVPDGLAYGMLCTVKR